MPGLVSTLFACCPKNNKKKASASSSVVSANEDEAKEPKENQAGNEIADAIKNSIDAIDQNITDEISFKLMDWGVTEFCVWSFLSKVYLSG